MHPLLSWLIAQCSWGTHATRTGISNVMPHILRFDSNVTQDVLDAKKSIAFGALWKKHVEPVFSTRKLPPVRKIYDVRHFFFEKKTDPNKANLLRYKYAKKECDLRTFKSLCRNILTGHLSRWFSELPVWSDIYPFPGGYPGMYKTL